ncbi:DUF2125 domain-containing protein [Parasedimentitalea marina]|uniref:DUF2125 domain-containing protein n=1 Tax=Parasedimentitalea marina TaxID=2483033 RepID=A0A3T0N7B4_9RHOB|nr:DUF2125 domain-containing protein [Parasedimentitalea marina]AZV79869.1 DUF2125 domain-containing protein [Parasedimentitalea marina]
MKLKTSTALLSIGFATLTAAPALADITADDIWNSYQVIAETVGGELTATTTRDGNTVTFADAKLHLVFPGDEASLDVLYPTLSYTDNGDGTLSMDLEGAQTYSFVLSGPEPETDRFSADMIITYSDAELVASGDPDDITFSYAMDGFDFEFQNIDLSGLKDAEISENAVFTLTGTGSAVNGTSRLSLGDLITLAGQSEISGMGYSMTVENMQGAVTTTTASYGEMVSQSTITLPTGGMSFMNLAAALHQGLSLEGTGTYGSSKTQTSVMMNGEQVSSQTMTAGSSTSALSANAEAVQLTAKGSNIGIDALINIGMALSIEAKIDQVTGDFRMPVSASDEQQNFTMAFGFTGLDLGDGIWSMFDPAEVLPRDPANVSVNLTGQTTLTQDLLNFVEMMALDNDDIPLELNALTIKDFLISAAGASLSGTGDFAFNNDDLTSFDGMPAPSGSANLQLNGANGLIDRLIEMGLVQESDAMGVRMMMGMMAVPGEGDDSLKSEIEITEDGQITANGQRIK